MSARKFFRQAHIQYRWLPIHNHAEIVQTELVLNYNLFMTKWKFLCSLKEINFKVISRPSIKKSF